MKLRIASAVGIALALLITGMLGGPGPTLAFQSPIPGGPANDKFLDATAFTGSYSASVDVAASTIELGEPLGCYDSFGMQLQHSVWYKFTPPASGLARIKVNGLWGAYSDNYFNVYRATAPDPVSFAGLETPQVLCAAYRLEWNDPAQLIVAAGQTYFIQLGNLGFDQPGSIFFSLDFLPAPANDNFASAAEIVGLPFSASLDNRAASLESGEPAAQCGSAYRTVWYKYTPTETRSVLIRPVMYPVRLAIYTGSALDALTPVGCALSYFNPVVLRVQPGTTYHLQLGDSGYYFGSQTTGFSMDFAPQPTADFYYYAGDPSVFDNIQFQDTSYDPAWQQFQSWTWSFGDGTTATVSSPAHKYTQDGSYTVEHTSTTVDGRTASVSKVVQVQTHDVAIARIQTPNSAAAGQTRQLLISVSSKRYNETIEVTLYKSVPGGLARVGSYAQYVPVRPPGGKATDFTFSYTFTPEDASIGKVSFKAVASIVNARDALPADNEAVAPPTKVTR